MDECQCLKRILPGFDLEFDMFDVKIAKILKRFCQYIKVRDGCKFFGILNEAESVGTQTILLLNKLIENIVSYK